MTRRRYPAAFPPYRGTRVLDLAVLAVLAVPAVLVGLVCVIAVKLTSRGPVFFRQERIGRDGVPFQVWKFRTMLVGDNPIVPDASRITFAGRWLRRLSLDELPQLLNVAVGEMSVVGPRPTLAYQVARYDRRQRLRLCVRPGLTGWAQVNGRNALSWAERFELDIAYVQTQSMLLDVKILAATARVVLSGEGIEGHDLDDPFVTPDVVPAGAPSPADPSSAVDPAAVDPTLDPAAGDPSSAEPG